MNRYYNVLTPVYSKKKLYILLRLILYPIANNYSKP